MCALKQPCYCGLACLLLLLSFARAEEILTERIDISTLTALPQGWQQKGMWGFDRQLIMSPQAGKETYMQRKLEGDGHIVVGFDLKGMNESVIPGVRFTFSGGSISLERRVMNGKTCAVMLVKRDEKTMDKVVSIPAGDVEMKLQRQGSSFSGWVAESGQNFSKVAALGWNNIDAIVQAGIYGRIEGGSPAFIQVVSLEVAGAMPDRPKVSLSKRKSEIMENAPRETIDITKLTAIPNDWTQQGMWAFDKQMVMRPQKGKVTHLRRELSGDGYILVRYWYDGLNDLAIPGASFYFEGGSIRLERRVIQGTPHAVMLIDQGGKKTERTAVISGGDIEMMLKREGSRFSSWIAEPGQEFVKVAGLSWEGVNPIVQIGICGRVLGDAPAPFVKVLMLEAGGRKPTVRAVSQNKRNNEQQARPSVPPGSHRVGKIASINTDWGFVVIQLNQTGIAAKGSQLYVLLPNGRPLILEVKRITDTKASAIPHGPLGAMQPGMIVLRKEKSLN